MAFWGVELKGEKPGCFVPPPKTSRLHLSQATLDFNAPKGVRVIVSCRPSNGDDDEDEVDEQEEQQIMICSLREGVQETCNLDLVFDHYTEFTVKGSDDAVVHLAGYHIPEDMDDDEDDDYGLGEQDLSNGQLEALLQSRPDLLAQYGGSDDDSDSDDGLDEDESDEDESEEGTSDEEDDGPTQRNASVIIEDVTDAKEKAKADKGDGAEAMDIEVLVPLDSDKKPEDAGTAHPSPEPAKPADSEPPPKSTEQPDTVKEPKQPDIPIESPADLAQPQNDSAEPEVAVLVAQKPKKGDKAKKEMDDSAEPEVAVLVVQKPKKGDKAKKERQAARKGAKAKEEVELEETDEDEDEEEESEEEEPPAAVKGKKRKPDEPAVQPAAKKVTVEAKKGKAAKEAAPQAQKPAKQEGKQKPAKNGEAQDADGAGKSKVKKFPNGMIIEETGMGDPAGKLAKAGKKVSVKYVGKLQKTGKVFDQTKGNKTFQFRLGVGEVIKGWDQGVVGMRVGDKRRLTVPPQMAYGSGGVKNVIPGNATLVFDVELTDVKG